MHLPLRPSVGLANGALFLSKQKCKEKQRLEECVHSLTLKWDIYLQEIHKAYATLAKAFYFENSSMAQHLTKYSNASVTNALESFENSLQQIKHFHHSLRVLRKKN